MIVSLQLATDEKSETGDFVDVDLENTDALKKHITSHKIQNLKKLTKIH